MNRYTALRALIGAIFIVSGFEKLISPYQNFLYVVQGYELFPDILEGIIARVMPWIEFMAGVYLLLGLWTRWAAYTVLAMTAGFIFVVGQAMIRGLAITECGCFGDFIAVPLYVILIFDIIMLFAVDFLMHREERASALSLDRHFSN